MMYPPLAKVQYGNSRRCSATPASCCLSLVQNWLVGPC
jgi:ACR3 family arsenite efflux pump ArsB